MQNRKSLTGGSCCRGPADPGQPWCGLYLQRFKPGLSAISSWSATDLALPSQLILAFLPLRHCCRKDSG